MARKKKEEDYAAELEKSFARWEHLYKNGGTDPFWPDGTNLNLVRNHIFYYKQKIIETFSEGQYPEVFHRPDPPEVNADYVARAEEIRQTAAKVLERFRQDENYRYLLMVYEFIKPDAKKDMRLDALLSRVTSLKMAIRQDDLVYMRRVMRFVDDDIAGLAECAIRVKQLPQHQKNQTRQLSLM